MSKVKSSKNPEQTSWVASSFDDVKLSVPTTQSKRKVEFGRWKSGEGSEAGTSKQTFNHRHKEDVLWVEKYVPKKKDDLAVHKKKIEELEQWLLEKCVNVQKQCSAGMVLLTGPCGAGKTATLRVLCAELGIDVQEWVCPLSIGNRKTFTDGRFDDEFYGESQISSFQSFFLRANKYPSLLQNENSASRKKVVVVEDFPNVVLQDPATFHSLLRTYSCVSKFPAVFILSTGAGIASSEHKLFPKDLQTELGIVNISFNPISTTNLVKALQRILSEESNVPAKIAKTSRDKPYLESLSDCSGGDLRSAINSLQFSGSNYGMKANSSAARGKTRGATTSRSKKTTSTNRSEGPSAGGVGGRDMSLYLFRALGKVLYCKRDKESKIADTHKLPESLKEMERIPLLVNPEEVLDKVELSHASFQMFLHHNYPSFFTSLDDLVRAAEYISLTDALTAEWTEQQEVLQEYASQVTVRGLLHANTAVSGGSWKPLHKPQWTAVYKSLLTKTLEAKEAFKECQWPDEELLTQLVPYMVYTGIPSKYYKYKGLVDELGRLDRSNLLRRREDPLYEAMQVEDSLSEFNIEFKGHGQDAVIDAGRAEDEEVIIEEYED